MALVDYSDSSDGDGEVEEARPPLLPPPPPPPAFRDLYSSTVRTSTEDDPSLHGGRKRGTPHVAGNWPTHVYLHYYHVLQDLVSHAQTCAHSKDDVRTLLENDLGVQQPLHVSLSRPLALRTEDKDNFLHQLKTAIRTSNVATFDVQPLDLLWHPNEEQTRWFLVVRLQRPAADELRVLLQQCNALASLFAQPLLYDHQARPDRADSRETANAKRHDSFHISIAWSGQPQETDTRPGSTGGGIMKALLGRLNTTTITFSEVKVRVGQDVHSVPLRQARKR